MKHLKTFENNNTFKEKPPLQPEVNNYVICKEITHDKNVNHFLNNNVGQISEIDSARQLNNYLIFWENVPEELDCKFIDNKRFMSRDEIIYFSYDKEFLETMISSNKYNL